MKPKSRLHPLGVFILLFMLGCVNMRNFEKYHDKHEQQASGKCAAWYPSVASTKETVKYTEGKHDTVVLAGPESYFYVDCDSAIKAATKTGTTTKVRVLYPVHDTVFINTTDTLSKHDTTVLVNTASVTNLTLRAETAEKSLAASQEKSTIYLWWAIIASAIIVIRVLLKFLLKI